MLVFGGSTCACTIFPHLMFGELFLRSFRENLPILFGTGMWGTQRLTKVAWIPVWIIITRPVIPATSRSGGKPIWLVEGFFKTIYPTWMITYIDKWTSNSKYKWFIPCLYLWFKDTFSLYLKHPLSWGRYKGPAQLIIVTRNTTGHLQLHPLSPIAALLAIHPLEWQMLRSTSAFNARPEDVSADRLDFGYDISNFSRW